MERSPLAEGGLTAIVLKAVAGSLQYVVDRRAAPEERIVETVLLQRHVVLFLISLVLMSLWLVLGGTWRAWVFLARKLRDLALGGPSAERYMEGVSDDEDDGGAGVSAGVAREGEDDALLSDAFFGAAGRQTSRTPFLDVEADIESEI